MTTLITSQLRDVLAYIDALEAGTKALSDSPSWGGGMRLCLPAVIPLCPDYDSAPVAWLVANDFDGYDLTTEKPKGEA